MEVGSERDRLFHRAVSPLDMVRFRLPRQAPRICELHGVESGGARRRAQFAEDRLRGEMARRNANFRVEGAPKIGPSEVPSQVITGICGKDCTLPLCQMSMLGPGAVCVYARNQLIMPRSVWMSCHESSICLFFCVSLGVFAHFEGSHRFDLVVNRDPDG